MKEILFFEEIDRIQKRHALFFPGEQKAFIQIIREKGMEGLSFEDGYNLPDVITMEIQLAFKLIYL